MTFRGIIALWKKGNILFSIQHLPKSPLEGGGPMGRSSPSVI